VLGAELRAQPPDVHVDRAGAAEVVVAPDLLEQLRPGEHPGRVLGQELQQLELLEGQVQRAAAQPGGVARFVDHQVAGPDLARLGRPAGRAAANGQPQPGLDLARAGGVQHDVIGSPVGGDRRPAALGHHGEQRDLQAGRAQLAEQALGGDQIAPRVDQHGVGQRSAGDRGHLGRR
jgi:hypothetical protein